MPASAPDLLVGSGGRPYFPLTMESDKDPRAEAPASPKPASTLPGPPTKRPLALLAGLAAVVAVTGTAAVYGIGSLARNDAVSGVCTQARSAARAIDPFVRGEVAALTVAKAPQPLPVLSFRDGEDRARNLADWRGRTILLNLWATWCLPCRVEMPALDALQARLGSDAFEVVAVNIDTRDPGKPRAWLSDNGVTRLAYYADASARVFQDLKAAGKAFGMPTTVLIDPEGCEIASLAGPAEWASDDAVKLVEAALASIRRKD